MSFCAKIGAVLLLVLAVGCQEVPRYWGGGRVVLAEAAGRKLYAREVKAAIPKGVVGEDSVAFVNRYVEKWVHKQLKIARGRRTFLRCRAGHRFAGRGVPPGVLIRKFDQHLIEERIDTLVTADQILPITVNTRRISRSIKPWSRGGSFARRQQPAGAELRKLMTQPGSSRQQEFADICTKNNFVLNDFSSSWVTFSEFLGYLPTLRNQSYDALLSSRAVQEMSDGHSRYYFEISDVLRPGDPEPLERSEAIVRRILYNQRQNEIIRAYDEEVYRKAVEEGRVKIHEEEKIEN